jgi:hypothetical protein
VEKQRTSVVCRASRKRAFRCKTLKRDSKSSGLPFRHAVPISAHINVADAQSCRKATWVNRDPSRH